MHSTFRQNNPAIRLVNRSHQRGDVLVLSDDSESGSFARPSGFLAEFQHRNRAASELAFMHILEGAGADCWTDGDFVSVHDGQCRVVCCSCVYCLCRGCICIFFAAGKRGQLGKEAATSRSQHVEFLDCKRRKAWSTMERNPAVSCTGTRRTPPRLHGCTGLTLFAVTGSAAVMQQPVFISGPCDTSKPLQRHADALVRARRAPAWSSETLGILTRP